MMAACPNCGAPVEFRFDDSLVRVCGSCRSSVLRTDRGIETLGQFADIAAIPSAFWLHAGGALGGVPFQITGRVQIRHAAGGVWQEWFAKFADGRWGWIAEAQGRFFVTFEMPHASALPRVETLRPGMAVDLLVPVQGGAAAQPATFYVAEFGEATYLAGEGELPFRVAANEPYRFADLSDGSGLFATIDYGAPGTNGSSLYVGRELGLAEFGLQGHAPSAAPGAPTLRARKLACPNCNGSIELQTPDQSLRVGCPYCGALLDCEGDLKILAPAKSKRPRPAISLGTKVTFEDTTFLVLGFMRRAAAADGETFPFDEYLLHNDRKGYRWLVCADGHWSYVTPLDPGSVRPDRGPTAFGATFKHFSQAPVSVKYVVGEFYWRVAVGDQVMATDYILPPYMLSKEESPGEQTWSLGRYVDEVALRKAVQAPNLKLPSAHGVAPHQPFPYTRGMRAAGWALLAFLAMAVITGIMVPRTKQHQGTVQAEVTTEGKAVAFTQPFQIKARRNIEIRMTAPVNNTWIAIGGDLVNDATGELDAFDTEVAYYNGVDGGESWSEGSPTTKMFIGDRPAGTYVLRVETEGPAGAAPLPIEVTVSQGVFRLSHFFWGLGLFGGVWLVFVFLYLRFENKRKENSDGGSPMANFLEALADD